MNPRLVELALRKQRLQIRAEYQRDDMARRLQGLTPAFDTVDRARDGLAWLRDHAPLVTAVVAGLALARPRRAWIIAKRAWLGWMLLRRGRLRGGGTLMSALTSPLLRGVATLLLDRLKRARG